MTAAVGIQHPVTSAAVMSSVQTSRCAPAPSTPSRSAA